MADLSGVLTLADASALLAAGACTAEELARHCLDRIAAVDGRVSAFVTVTTERALADAHQADARLAAGRDDDRPLVGIPIALKDLIATRGIRTTASSRVLADWTPAADAVPARALAAAGTVLLGKTRTHEFAYGAYSLPTRNPWDLERVPGGSSGGSAAAIAAGLALGAVGSDTGGSIRIPAACCGVSGFKPTLGLVSTEGVIPLSWTLDHVGPIARSVRDCALLLDGLMEYELFEPRRPLPGLEGADALRYADATGDHTATLAGLRLGVPTSYFFDHVDPEVEAAVRAAIRMLAALGAEVVDVEVPAALGGLFAVYRAVQRPEALTAHQDAGWWPARADDYTAPVRAALQRGAEYSAVDHIRAQRARVAFAAEMDALLTRVDALLTPTLPLVAPRVAELDRPITIQGREEDAGLALLRLTFPFDMSGQPALTVPCGFAAGMPIGLQIVGRQFDEATVLRVGHAYQRDTNWHLRRPVL
ncbi:MAG TPA: amidase [Ktedonobacterales bacterium]|jgi:aspartyl-tRNA(Asn)/glutamyl-tRNA(Gln) amidotransferase subunit A